MSRTSRLRFPASLLIALLFMAGYVMLADFVNLRIAQDAGQTPRPLDELAMPQPWGGYGWRALARLAGDASRIDPVLSEDVLKQAGRRYPLDAVQWVDLARIHARAGETEPVDSYLARASAVQPLERRSLWAAAQVALQTGNAQLAERQLRQWLQLYPRDTGQALFIGSRWIDEPGTLLDRMLPEGDEYLAQAMEVARRQTDVALAEAVWDRLTPKPDLDDLLFLNFVELLLQTGDVSRAIELWAERDPAYQGDFTKAYSPDDSRDSNGSRQSIRLVNGDFTRPLGKPLAFNWRVNRPPPGVRVERDTQQAFTGPASLRLTFNGKENLSLGEPWIPVPVEPGQHYRLSGAWRADALTTRSLPYWYLTAEQGELRERHGVPGGNFGWERWQIEFQAPEEARLVRLQLRRDRTNAFDRNIDGTLWLDDFRLEPIAEPRTLESAASQALGRQAGVKTPVDGLGNWDEFSVFSFQFSASGYGKNDDAGAAEAGSGSVGAVSGRDSSAPETPPTTANGQQPTASLNFRKPETGNRKPSWFVR